MDVLDGVAVGIEVIPQCFEGLVHILEAGGNIAAGLREGVQRILKILDTPLWVSRQLADGIFDLPHAGRKLAHAGADLLHAVGQLVQALAELLAVAQSIAEIRLGILQVLEPVGELVRRVLGLVDALLHGIHGVAGDVSGVLQLV